MKKVILFFVLALFALPLVACGADNDVAVSVALTQTAIVPEAAPETVPEATPEATGVIAGTANLMAPPTPALVIYAVNTATGEWFFVETPETDGVTSFSLEVSPGTYQVFSAGLGYSLDGLELSLVIVNAGQTTSGIELHIPSPSECGPMLSIPASPDGKFAAVPGATEECLASLSVPKESELMPIQFAAGDDSTQIFGSLPPGGINHYVLSAEAGQEMTVSLDAFDGNNTTLAIAGADGTILNQYDTSSPSWTGVLPYTQEYYIDILSTETEATIDYAIVVAIITNTGGVSGITNYPEATFPPMHIIATERATGNWYWIGTAENAGMYVIDFLPPGSYLITAYTQHGLVGGYVDGNGSFLPVTVGASELVEDIYLSWWGRSNADIDPVGW